MGGKVRDRLRQSLFTVETKRVEEKREKRKDHLIPREGEVLGNPETR